MPAKLAGARPKSQALLLNFRAVEAVHAVTRQTVKEIAESLGLNESQAVHYALASLRDKVLLGRPAHSYEPDDGPLSPEHIRAIRGRVGHLEFNPTSSIPLDR